MNRSPLLDLPPELRNRIYEFALISEYLTNVAPRIRSQHPARRNDTAALLRTCRQIRQEAASTYYISNTFISELWSAHAYDYKVTLSRWLLAIGPRNLAYLRRIRVVGTLGIAIDYDTNKMPFDAGSWPSEADLMGAKRLFKGRGIDIDHVELRVEDESDVA